jgi:hypothetical protein
MGVPCIKTAGLHLRLGTGQRIQESGSVVTAEIMLSLLMKGLEPFEPIGPLNWSTKKKNSTNWEMDTKWERMCLWHKLMTDWWEESKKRTWQDGEIVLLQWVSHSYVAILLLAIPMCGCLWSACCSDWSTLVKNTWQLSVRTKVWNKSSL